MYNNVANSSDWMQCLYENSSKLENIFFLKTNYLLASSAIYSLVGENAGGDGWRRPHNYLRRHGEPGPHLVMEEI